VVVQVSSFEPNPVLQSFPPVLRVGDIYQHYYVGAIVDGEYVERVTEVDIPNSIITHIVRVGGELTVRKRKGEILMLLNDHIGQRAIVSSNGTAVSRDPKYRPRVEVMPAKTEPLSVISYGSCSHESLFDRAFDWIVNGAPYFFVGMFVAAMFGGLWS
jgi:hypothetical protein